ncbi:flagellar filament capping protein FliD [Aquabacterium sp. J223]|uniref:flagellar filament capping protein FliD n=1 Tax=Aquabacterium sp. J223 TaxID=2898431 RepID=UPI0021ADDB0D|nr:flagellar filament capping protein FliD [Aquabacterium sp. J223]UUX94869.1 flagellar filament capping protein FliD [Aquabacterium sp. J223]
MAISSTGLGSGLDVETIVSQLVALERKPITQLQTQKTELDTQVSSFGKVQSMLSTLRDAARTLTDASTWRAATAGVSDETVVKATATSGAPIGSYNITVARLAAAQAVTSAAFASATASIGEGTITIDIGRWTDGTPPSFTPRSTPPPVAVTIGPGDNTLEKIRDKINAAGAGVTATIVRDVTGARLSIRSAETGLENGFRIQTSSTSGDLSGLNHDPASGSGGMALSQKAQNASATIDGIAIESASNSVNEVIDGISLQLLKPTATVTDPQTNTTTAVPVTLSVSHDNESIKKAITDFSTAYNDVVKYLREQTAYNADTKKAGPLQGDRTAIGLLGQLRGLVSNGSSASSAFGRLSDIGLDPQSDGSLKVNGGKLDKAIGKLDELAKAFSTLGDEATPGSASNGIGQQFKLYLAGLLGAEGPLESRKEGLNSRIKRNDDQQDRLEDRVAAFEKRIRLQYQTLDAKMSSLSGLSSYVSQQMSLLAKQSS